jgi:hypothetical protein
MTMKATVARVSDHASGESRTATASSPYRHTCGETARRVGERFLNGYVAFLYGRGSVDEIEGATRELGRVLRRARVWVPPARAARTARIVGLQSTEQPPATVVVTATVDDGDLAAYPVTALVERRAGSWRVIRLADD